MSKSVSSRVLFLWSTPRSLSTAFLRMMIERGDHHVVHEPFSALAEEGCVTLRLRECRDRRGVISELVSLSACGPVFVKETTDYDHCVEGIEQLIDAGRHTFLIRHPKAVIPSFAALYPDITCDQVGFKQAWALFSAIRDRTGSVPTVIQAEGLAGDTEATVKMYCEDVEMPFVSDSLNWAMGDQDVWVRSKEAHLDVALSTGFYRRPRYGNHVGNSRRLREYYDFHLPYYNLLKNYAL